MFSNVAKELIQRLCRFAWFHVRGNRFSLELFYFLFVSLFGFFILQTLDGRTPSFTRPRNLDLFFTSVSAVTTSSMSVIEMEFFSNTQLAILTILMFGGGEVFTSLVMHYIHMFFINVSPKDCNIVNPASQCGFFDTIELENIKIQEFGNAKSDNLCNQTFSTAENYKEGDLRYKSLKFLGFVVLFYLVCVQVLGLVSVLIYLNVISSAKDILNQKGIHSLTFSIFTTVSTFANCGFLPNNENMLIFRKNSGLLLILIPQALLGNTLYPPAFRFLIWAIGKFVKKSETTYLLDNSKGMIGYHHLHSFVHSSLLSVSALVLIVMQYVVFSSMEWSSGSLGGLSVYQKLVGILFQTVNTRHAGESIVDLSTVSGAVLVLFVLMMYLPPYTVFLPVEEDGYNYEKGNKRSTKILENLVFSQQTYLIIFIILVCITERKQMVNDPLNFNVLNIVFEVISAYGNVGLSTGYRCDLRLEQDGGCQNKWYGFSGRWSDQGKLVLIVVMIFGKLKKFNMNGGKTWKVL
ncbi:hypothetical protein SSX86_011141 [Deinandra increscens subsp. villosa]|uniref:Uncharacterized protein n=1 Tax=Deinandra increscens subsp. villosa TaxID=3103831 RepID=A0AAP0H2Y6_9ASTR